MPPELEEAPAKPVEPSKEALSFFSDMKGNVTPPVKPDEVKPAEVKPAEVKPAEVKPDEDGLILQREEKKPAVKATPDQSIAALRKQRDELAERNKGFTELFGENPPQVIKPIYELVSELSEGPITENSVKSFIEEHKTAKDRIAELEAKLGEKEKVITEVDIRYSDEFKNNFDLPYKAAAQELFLEFANIQGEETIAPHATKAFNDFLLSKPDANGVEVKGKLAEFVRAYKEESGEDPIVPSITSIMNALRGFKDKAIKLQDAYNNWSVKKKETVEKKMADQQIQNEATNKALAAKRKDLAGKAFREFNLDDTPFIETSEIEFFVREEYQFGEDIRDGKVPEYDEFIKRGVEARLWKKYGKRLTELLELEQSVEKGERNDLTGENRITKKSADGKIDWLTMK